MRKRGGEDLGGVFEDGGMEGGLGDWFNTAVKDALTTALDVRLLDGHEP